METKKIALACFIGGLFCVTAAFMLAPNLWFFGLLAGFAGGYLSYEFRQVLRAVPKAIRATGEIGLVFISALTAIKKLLASEVRLKRAWLAKPHPFGYPAVLIIMPLLLFAMCSFHKVAAIAGTRSQVVALAIFGLIFLPLAFLELSAMVASLISLSAFIGARVGEQSFWQPFFIPGVDDANEVRDLVSRGLRSQPATYCNVARWTGKGVLITVKFFLWTIWKYAFKAALVVACFLIAFVWAMFKLIHSEKRTLCGIYGALGGTVSYLFFAQPGLPLTQKVLVAVFGGLIGALLGILNYELVSIRLLKLARA